MFVKLFLDNTRLLICQPLIYIYGANNVPQHLQEHGNIHYLIVVCFISLLSRDIVVSRPCPHASFPVASHRFY